METLVRRYVYTSVPRYSLLKCLKNKLKGGGRYYSKNPLLQINAISGGEKIAMIQSSKAEKNLGSFCVLSIKTAEHQQRAMHNANFLIAMYFQVTLEKV